MTTEGFRPDCRHVRSHRNPQGDDDAAICANAIAAADARRLPPCHLYYGAIGAIMAPCRACRSKMSPRARTECFESVLHAHISPYRNTFGAV